MRTPLSILTAVSLLLPMAAAAETSIPEASLMLLRDHKNDAKVRGPSRRFLQGKVQNRMLSTISRFSRPSMLNKAFNTYVNEQHGISVGYPGDWKILDGFMSTVVSFLSPLTGPEDNLTENANILVESYEPGKAPTLRESTDRAMQQLEALEGFTIHNMNRSAIVDVYPAVSLTYSAGNSDQMLTFKQVWTMHKNALYVFTFAASPQTYREYVGAFEKMMATVELD